MTTTIIEGKVEKVLKFLICKKNIWKILEEVKHNPTHSETLHFAMQPYTQD